MGILRVISFSYFLIFTSSCNIFGDSQLQANFVKKQFSFYKTIPMAPLTLVSAAAYTSDGDYLFACDSSVSLFIILNVMDENNPYINSQVTDTEGSVSCTSLKAHGDTLIKIDAGSNFYAYDISNPEAQTFPASTYTTGASIQDILVTDSRVYLIRSDSLLEIWGIGNEPDNMSFLGMFAIPSGTAAMAIHENFLFVAGNVASGDFAIYDVSNPESVVQVASKNLIAFSTPSDVIYKRGRVYIGYSANNTYRIVDVKDPTSPVVVHSGGTAGIVELIASDFDLFVYDNTGASLTQYDTLSISTTNLQQIRNQNITGLTNFFMSPAQTNFVSHNAGAPQLEFYRMQID